MNSIVMVGLPGSIFQYGISSGLKFPRAPALTPDNRNRLIVGRLGESQRRSQQADAETYD
jgi:hypothetical protein